MARFSSTFLFLGSLAASGAAEASSLIVLETTNDPVGPSMIVAGAPEPASPEAAGPAGTGSILAIGEAPPAVSGEKLSSITGGAPRSGRQAVPIVIRGGIVGNAFARSLPAPAAAAPSPTVEKTPEPSRAEPETSLVGPSAESELNLQ